MKLIRKASASEIEQHLIKLGKGNHEDNMKQVNGATDHDLVELSEEDFRNLIFLKNRHVAKIMPQDGERRLWAVAHCAIDLPEAEWKMHPNWDLGKIHKQTERWLESKQPLDALLLRATRDSELVCAPDGWYLQDGSHRALGYCQAIVRGQARYSPQLAFRVTGSLK